MQLSILPSFAQSLSLVTQHHHDYHLFLPTMTVLKNKHVQ